MQEIKPYHIIKRLSFTLIFLYSVSICPFFERKITEAEVVYSKAECVMEMESRRILYEVNGETRLPMASTTKIATAATVLENYSENLEGEIEVPDDSIGIEGSSIYLQKGDKYSTKDLLYGLMLRSGNDAATALAIRVGGSIANFSVLMNDTAKKAGAVNSNFVNPHGLPCKGHYTTARDLSYITCYAMHNELFREIVATRFYQPHNWTNKNKILKNYQYAIGVKTGYTKEAGRCLVSAATKEEMTLVCTVLSCGDMYNRSISLFENCFSQYKREKILNAEDVFEIEGRTGKVSGRTITDFYYPLCEGEREHLEIVTESAENGKILKKEGEIIGQIKIYLLKRLIFSGNLYKL